MNIFTIEDEYDIPKELLEASTDNSKIVQVKTIIGWIDTSDPEFRCDNTYRVIDK